MSVTSPFGSALQVTAAPVSSAPSSLTVKVSYGWPPELRIHSVSLPPLIVAAGSLAPNSSTSVPFSVVQLMPNFPATVFSSVLWKGVPKVLPPLQEVSSQ